MATRIFLARTMTQPPSLEHSRRTASNRGFVTLPEWLGTRLAARSQEVTVYGRGPHAALRPQGVPEIHIVAPRPREI